MSTKNYEGYGDDDDDYGDAGYGMDEGEDDYASSTLKKKKKKKTRVAPVYTNEDDDDDDGNNDGNEENDGNTNDNDDDDDEKTQTNKKSASATRDEKDEEEEEEDDEKEEEEEEEQETIASPSPSTGQKKKKKKNKKCVEKLDISVFKNSTFFSTYGKRLYFVPEHAIVKRGEPIPVENGEMLSKMIHSRSAARWENVRSKHVTICKNTDNEEWTYIQAYVPGSPEEEFDKKRIRFIPKAASEAIVHRISGIRMSPQKRESLKPLLEFVPRPATSGPQINPITSKWEELSDIDVSRLPTAEVSTSSSSSSSSAKDGKKRPNSGSSDGPDNDHDHDSANGVNAGGSSGKVISMPLGEGLTQDICFPDSGNGGIKRLRVMKIDDTDPSKFQFNMNDSTGFLTITEFY